MGKYIDTVDVSKVSEDDLASMMVGRNVNFKVDKQEQEPGDVVLDVKDLHAVDYRGVEILRGLNLQVRKGQILGLAGIDGNGQTELVECITGLRKATKGAITVNGTDVFNKPPRYGFEHGVSSIPADRQKHGLVLEFSVADNMVLQNFAEDKYSSHGIRNMDAVNSFTQEAIEKFDIRPRDCLNKPAGTLSGGNQQKVIIAREVTNNKDLLIAVNPTRGLDVGAIEYVHKYIVEQRNKGKAVLLVSFELDEIISLSDEIDVIFDGRINGSLPEKMRTKIPLACGWREVRRMNKLEKFLNSKFLVTLFSILLGFVVGALFLAAHGISPIEAYAKLFDGVFAACATWHTVCVCNSADLYRSGGGVLVPYRRVQHRC